MGESHGRVLCTKRDRTGRDGVDPVVGVRWRREWRRPRCELRARRIGDRVVDRHASIAPPGQVQPRPSFQRLARCAAIRAGCPSVHCGMPVAVPDDVCEVGWRRRRPAYAEGPPVAMARSSSSLSATASGSCAPPIDGAQQDVAGRRARREDARLPEHAQRPQPLAARHEKAEAVEGMGDRRPRIAKCDDGDRRRRDRRRAARKRRDRTPAISRGRDRRMPSDDDVIGLESTASGERHTPAPCGRGRRPRVAEGQSTSLARPNRDRQASLPALCGSASIPSRERHEPAKARATRRLSLCDRRRRWPAAPERGCRDRVPAPTSPGRPRASTAATRRRRRSPDTIGSTRTSATSRPNRRAANAWMVSSSPVRGG